MLVPLYKRHVDALAWLTLSQRTAERSWTDTTPHSSAVSWFKTQKNKFCITSRKTIKQVSVVVQRVLTSPRFGCNHFHRWAVKLTANMATSGRPSSFPESRPQDAKGSLQNPGMFSRDLIFFFFFTVGVKDHLQSERPHKFNIHGRFAGKKPLLSKKNLKARLMLATEKVDKEQRCVWTPPPPTRYSALNVSHSRYIDAP